jgi:uncharacterized coiled-coil protein SlyX
MKMDDNIESLKNKIAEQTKTISRLNEETESKNKELEKYRHMQGRLRHLKHKATRYNRDRIVLAVFSVIMIAAFCYQVTQQNQTQLEQARLEKKYKQQNATSAPPGVLNTETIAPMDNE